VLCLSSALWILSFNQVPKTVETLPIPLDCYRLILLDRNRNRQIPVTITSPVVGSGNRNRQVIIFSHGYGKNQPGSNEAYSYLTQCLARAGYFVASIQHELSSDELLPMQGVPQIVRRPNWERGVTNILFTLTELKRRYRDLDFECVTLIGHSNGGDMSMLFASSYPKLVNKVISLDNRRMSFPRVASPRLFSLRSSDQPADEGVLPSLDEANVFGIKIVRLPNTTHNDMDESGTLEQHEEINRYVLQFLGE
jgi:dienelactone hydrolase